MQLPAWRYWALFEAHGKDRVRDQISAYKATGAGAGGFEQRSREEIIESWNKQMSTPIRGIEEFMPPDAGAGQLELDREERLKIWQGVG